VIKVCVGSRTGASTRAKTDEHNAVDETIDRYSGKDRARLETFPARNEPGPYDWARAQGNEQARQVSEHNCTEKAQSAAGPHWVEHLPPLPCPYQLLTGDRDRNEHQHAYVSDSEYRQEIIYVDATQQE
jgi:hypothetical protein